MNNNCTNPFFCNLCPTKCCPPRNTCCNNIIPIPGPQGPAGTDGTAATITVGTTTTGAPGTQASVTNVGTPNAAVLNFVIPEGQPGTITPGVAVPLLDATATLPDVITTVNALITSLTNAGFLA